MAMMVSFVLTFFPQDVLEEILDLIESVSEGFPTYSHNSFTIIFKQFSQSLMQKCKTDTKCNFNVKFTIGRKTNQKKL